MINEQLINPQSIVVVGGSNDLQKPGGKILHNILECYRGEIYVTNPKHDFVQGVKSYREIRDLPDDIDLAVIAVAAKYCPATVKVLAKEKNTKAFIVISAGFSEENGEGAKYEQQVVETVNEVDGCLIGPNCIGVINVHHHSIFTEPIPMLDPSGADFISGSGATAVFILETGVALGLRFNSILFSPTQPAFGISNKMHVLNGLCDISLMILMLLPAEVVIFNVCSRCVIFSVLKMFSMMLMLMGSSCDFSFISMPPYIFAQSVFKHLSDVLRYRDLPFVSNRHRLLKP